MKTLLMEIYDRLYRTFGPQHWWPGDTAFEMMVGPSHAEHLLAERGEGDRCSQEKRSPDSQGAASTEEAGTGFDDSILGLLPGQG